MNVKNEQITLKRYLIGRNTKGRLMNNEADEHKGIIRVDVASLVEYLRQLTKQTNIATMSQATGIPDVNLYNFKRGALICPRAEALDAMLRYLAPHIMLTFVKVPTATPDGQLNMEPTEPASASQAA